MHTHTHTYICVCLHFFIYSITFRCIITFKCPIVSEVFKKGEKVHSDLATTWKLKMYALLTAVTWPVCVNSYIVTVLVLVFSFYLLSSQLYPLFSDYLCCVLRVLPIQMTDFHPGSNLFFIIRPPALIHRKTTFLFRTILCMFHHPVVASVFLMQQTGDANGLNKLFRMAGSVLGVQLYLKTLNTNNNNTTQTIPSVHGIMYFFSLCYHLSHLLIAWILTLLLSAYLDY